MSDLLSRLPFTPETLLSRPAPVYVLKRQAKQLSRTRSLPLHQALDLVARQEGYGNWSLLLARRPRSLQVIQPAALLLEHLQPGDLLLLAARPGLGKTLLALSLLVTCIKAGGQGACFSLEYSDQEIMRRLTDLGAKPDDLRSALYLDSSDGISATHIITSLAAAPRNTLVVIDYLQLLDQRRDTPALTEQLRLLKDFAQQRGVRFVFISQIDRRFEASEKPSPGLEDIRITNPLDLSLFTKTCFLNGQDLRFGEP